MAEISDLRLKLSRSRARLPYYSADISRSLLDKLLASLDPDGNLDLGDALTAVVAATVAIESEFADLKSQLSRIGRLQSEEWVDERTVAQHIGGGWSDVAVRRLAREGHLPGAEIRPGVWRFRLSMVDEYLDEEAAAQVGWGGSRSQSPQSRGRKRLPG